MSSLPPDRALHIEDLGVAEGLVRAGQTGLDILATFLFAPIGLFAMFAGMFSVFFAAVFSVGALLRAFEATSRVGHLEFFAPDITFSACLAAVTFPAILVAVLAVVVTAARSPRVWGIVATALCAGTMIFVAYVGSHSAGREYGTWTAAVLVFLLTYGIGLVAAVASLALLAGIVVRRRTTTGRLAQAWPRFSISIFAARYGLSQAGFWRNLARIAARLAVTVSGLAIAFVGAVFLVALLGIATMHASGLEWSGFSPVWCIADTVLWSAVCALSIVSATRSSATRVVDIAVAAFAALAAIELGLSFGLAFHRSLEVGVGVFVLPGIGETELESLNAAALIWLFRSALSRAFVRAWSDLRLTSARTASELSKMRPEPPILFLRSFMDDEQLVASSDALLAYAFGAVSGKIRLEEIVAEIMFARGPLVALANPTVNSAPLGAARDVTADENWQEKVVSYLEASQIIVCFLGKTKSFQWEIDKIVARGKLDAMMIVLPPTYPHDRLLVNDSPRLAELAGLRGEADERERLDGARVLVYDASVGALRAVRSRRADSFSYREAIRIGAATILRNAARLSANPC